MSYISATNIWWVRHKRRIGLWIICFLTSFQLTQLLFVFSDWQIAGLKTKVKFPTTFLNSWLVKTLFNFESFVVCTTVFNFDIAKERQPYSTSFVVISCTCFIRRNIYFPRMYNCVIFYKELLSFSLLSQFLSHFLIHQELTK